MNFYRLVVVAALFFVALTVVDRCHRRSQSEWASRVERLQTQVQYEREQAEALKREATSARERADSIAETLESRAPEIRERVVVVQAETPEHLRDEPAILQRDTIIAELRVESDGWRSAFEAQREAYVALEGAIQVVESSRDSLQAVLRDRPGERPWYLPRLGVGPFAGVCAGGNPCAGPVAVSLTWELRL